MEIKALIVLTLITINVSLFNTIFCDTCVRDIQDFANATQLITDPSNFELLGDLDFTMDPTDLESFLDTCRFEPVPRLTTPRLCKVACSVLPPCMAYAFVDDVVTASGVTMSTGCELCVADTGGTGSSLLEHASNAIMVGLQAFREHILDTDACASSPCNLNGACTNDNAGYSCDCNIGFTGTNCETDIDACASDPCFPNGACTNDGYGYICDCNEGFTGTNCETVIPEDPSTSTGITLRVSSTTSTYWHRAREECDADDMHLVMPKTDEEIDNLRNEIGFGTQAFIGLRLQSGTEYRWVDGSTPSWTPWSNPIPGYGWCVYIDILAQGTYEFKRVSCESWKSYKVVCQSEQD